MINKRPIVWNKLLPALLVVVMLSCKTSAPTQSVASEEVATEAPIDLNQILPIDEDMIKGVLPNGMTYYIQHSDVVEDRATYYIIQNVGSILENDNQQGLAHFLEHMAFNGTETFPGKGMLIKMQENGLVFGRDINAYTSFDETVYNINNVPTTEEMTQLGLQILKDWSNYLLLTDEEIDAERGVIKEEWRQRRNAGMRIFEQTKDVVFGHSLYANRFPIGLMEVVENFEYDVMRDFYNDWYRTDLQAIAIVGDFDVVEMEEKVIAMYSSIPALENAPERPIIKIEDREELDYVMAMDDEILQQNVSFMIRRDADATTPGSVGQLKNSLMNGLIGSIMGNRFNELSLDPSADFLRIQFSNGGSFVRGYESLGLTIMPKEGKIEPSFEVAMNELQRALRFGFTKAEIKRAVTQMSSSYDNIVATYEDRDHKSIVEYFQQNYLDGVYVGAIVPEVAMAKRLMASITNEDLKKHLQSHYTQKNRTLVVTGVKGKENLTEEQGKAIIARAESNTDLKPYEEEEESRSLMDGVDLTPGSIASTEENTEVGFTKYTLSNGIEVYHKYSDKEKNSVSMSAFSNGGASLLDDEDLYKVSFVQGLVGRSGLGEFDAIELQKVLTGKQASASAFIGGLRENIAGGSTTGDVETMLQLTNLRFTKPRFDEKAFGLLIENSKTSIKMSKQMMRTKMQDSITMNLYGPNDPAHLIMTEDMVDKITFEELKDIYLERFSNAADFKFMFVGDVSKEALKPLLTKYLASIPTTADREEWKDNYTPWIVSNVKKDIPLEMGTPKNTVRVQYQTLMEVSRKDRYVASVLGKILSLRYLESLREEAGGTYGARANAATRREPRHTGVLSISFDCNPDMREMLMSLVYEEIDKIKQGTIREDDFDKTIKSILKDRVDARNGMRFDSQQLSTYVREGYNMDAPENFEKLVKSITKEDVQEMAKRITAGNSFEFVFVPAQD